ncbi:hypothetical protein HELRODRAFT_72038 [Helobdella robusta]|uniref:Ionotropic glutamate receptor C-terminal domain-containing protein n=1 Tax=Helobdella robusta TaxID=6412 RepID=T1G0U4_HELRO|nr:hypothetical protein HELRODRAFT_72038 [Helobdella robusta]ESO10868.1 hypothetical protein HELRODRAFT_72038 [Helobdella robusta]
MRKIPRHVNATTSTATTTPTTTTTSSPATHSNLTTSQPNWYFKTSTFTTPPTTTTKTHSATNFSLHTSTLTSSIPSSESSASASDASSDFTIFMTPPYHEAIVDLVVHFKWEKLVYIYDTEQGWLERKKLHVIVRVYTRHHIIQTEGVRLKDTCNSYPLLRQLDRTFDRDLKTFVLDLSSVAAVEHLLQQIKHVGMHRPNYHYIIAGVRMDEIDLREFKYGGVNFTGFRLVDPNEGQVQQAQRDWSTVTRPGTDQPIKLEAWLTMDTFAVIVSALRNLFASNLTFYKDTFRKNEIFGISSCRLEPPSKPWELGRVVTDALKQVSLNGYTGPVSFNSQGHRVNFRLDVLEMTFNSDVTKVGTWNDSHQLTIFEPNITGSSRGNNHTKIRITSIISPPYLMYRVRRPDEPPLVGNDQFEGYCKELADKIAEIVRFEYTLRLVADDKYGVKLPNGTYNGMVGELTNEVADLAIAPLTITSIREVVIDFSKPFMMLGISVMIRKPDKQKPGVLSFTDPLDYKIWLCVVLAYSGVSFVLFVVNSFKPYNDDAANDDDDDSNHFNLLNSLWFSLSAFMQQGCTLSPRSVSGRVAGSSWWFFTLILISTYTANLAAFLTVERMLTPIESASDLPKQNQIAYGTLDAGSTKEFFSTSGVTEYKQIWEYMQKNKEVYVKTTEEGVKRVRDSKGKYAFLLESTMNDYYNQKKPCNTMKVGPDLDTKGYGVATRLNHYLKDQVGLAVLQLKEKDELQRLHKKWWFDKGECAAESEKVGRCGTSLTLSHVAGIFYILVSGLLFALVVCLLEFTYYKKKRKTKKKVFS